MIKETVTTSKELAGAMNFGSKVRELIPAAAQAGVTVKVDHIGFESRRGEIADTLEEAEPETRKELLKSMVNPELEGTVLITLFTQEETTEAENAIRKFYQQVIDLIPTGESSTFKAPSAPKVHLPWVPSGYRATITVAFG